MCFEAFRGLMIVSSIHLNKVSVEAYTDNENQF